MCDFILLSYFFTIMMKRNNKKVSTMVYKLVIPMLCICSTMSLYAEEKGLGDIIQQVAQDKALVKPSVKKKEVKKASRFVFKDEYHANGIGDIDKTKTKDKSESYSYEDKSRFKFQFNDGSQQSNLMNRYGVGSIGMGGATGSGGQGSGGGRR